MQTAHVQALETKHADLEARIEAETVRPAADDLDIARLKKAKLRLKEQIENI